MRISEDEEVQHLILQLRRLQLQQEEILTRLERARNRESDRDNANGTSANRNTGADENRDRPFAIGDRVIIKNPGRYQADKGTIVRIGRGRFTVQTVSGGKILRVAKNLEIDHE